MGSPIIDFRHERERHETFFGREEVVAELDALLLQQDASHGWVLLTGGPGQGKSAIVSHWVGRLERSGHPVVHHFIRRGVADWAQPAAVARSLAAQLEAMLPGSIDPDLRREGRLLDLLSLVSEQVLVPGGQRLVLVIDGLDEVEGEEGNPLPRFLPHTLPRLVFVLCASRPAACLDWLEARDNLRRIDLGSSRWSSSNEEACRAFWRHHGPRFAPPLPPPFIAEAAARAEGSMLHAVKLRDWLFDQPPGQRRNRAYPRGLRGFWQQIWTQVSALPKDRLDRVTLGLGLLCAAREALPTSALEDAAGWESPSERDDCLKQLRPFLLEESGALASDVAYRPYHAIFREYIAEKLGPRAMRRAHSRLAKTVAKWPPAEDRIGFGRSYALHHAVAHRIDAYDWEGARQLCLSPGFLETRCREAGVASVEADLQYLAGHYPDQEARREMADLYDGVLAESHWLWHDPGAFPSLLYNRLRCLGWSPGRIERFISLNAANLPMRLRHPLPLRAGSWKRTVRAHAGEILAAAVTPDGLQLLSGSSENTLSVYDLASGKLMLTLRGHSAPVRACAVSGDGRWVLSGSADGTLRVWDLQQGALIRTLGAQAASVYACVPTPDSRLALSGAGDGTLAVWDLHGGQKLAELSGHHGIVYSCAVTPDGRRAVSGGQDGTLRVWDLLAGRPLTTIAGERGPVRACAVTPDGSQVVSGNADGTVQLWNLATGKLLLCLAGHVGEVYACAVTPDGGRLLSASRDNTLILWDLHRGTPIATLTGHSARVRTCAVTPDGLTAISGSSDGTLKIWNLARCQQPASATGHRKSVFGCAITPDGREAVSAADNHSLKVWDTRLGPGAGHPERTQRWGARLRGDRRRRSCRVRVAGRDNPGLGPTRRQNEKHPRWPRWLGVGLCSGSRWATCRVRLVESHLAVVGPGRSGATCCVARTRGAGVVLCGDPGRGPCHFGLRRRHPAAMGTARGPALGVVLGRAVLRVAPVGASEAQGLGVLSRPAVLPPGFESRREDATAWMSTWVDQRRRAQGPVSGECHLVTPCCAAPWRRTAGEPSSGRAAATSRSSTWSYAGS